MAQRRMFSPDIVCSDAFLDMPPSTQALYFHLAMRADDDGFVNPKMIMRLIGANEDDLKVLLAKRFVLKFDSGVVVIKHWLIHNLIRADLYKETLYLEEKSTIGIKDNGAYTELREGISTLKKIEAPEWLKRRRGELRTANVPQTVHRLGKVRLGKINTPSKDGGESNAFQEFYQAYPRKVGRKTAWISWNRQKLDSILPQILSFLEEACNSPAWANKRYIPHPTTFLNGQRWTDDISEYQAGKVLTLKAPPR